MARWAEGEGVAAALSEDALVVESNFDFSCLLHGHGTGHRMGGRRAVSEIVLRFFFGHVLFCSYILVA